MEKAQRGIIIEDERDKKTISNNQHYTYAKGVMDSFLKMAEGHVYELDKRMTGIGVPISFDTSKVTDMRYMFTGCNILTQITVSNKWVIKSGASTNEMFSNCGTDHVTVV